HARSSPHSSPPSLHDALPISSEPPLRTPHPTTPLLNVAAHSTRLLQIRKELSRLSTIWRSAVAPCRTCSSEPRRESVFCCSSASPRHSTGLRNRSTSG